MALLAFLSLVCGYVSLTFGGGYGLGVMPILFLMGFSVGEAVPAILLAHLSMGLLAALTHHRLKVADFKWGSEDVKLALALCSSGSVGVLLAVLGQVSLPELAVEAYVSLMVLSVGLALLAGLRIRVFNSGFSWKKAIPLALLASFNKGMGGGGYGPLLTGGQVLSGVGERKAIAITCLSGATTCLIGFLAYLIATGWASWELAFSLTIGASLSAPLSAYTVRKADPRMLRTGMGVVITSLGLAMMVRMLLGSSA
ncbi:hypothetical protein DRO32_00635 [Candidatus Bathyarchaeota archaeon]|nr:MAG: hypothetical protein DRO32_00635 [Candidatus Bathyarchaeota archaeon]